MAKRWGLVIFVIIVLGLLAMILAGLFAADDMNAAGNTALIKITGEIAPEQGGSIFGSSTTSAETVIGLIDKADNNQQVKAFLFDINSGGGYPVASEEIAKRIQKINKTKICLIREIGASGAYWIASACDLIVASRMSYVGSIGVIGSYLEFSGLMQKYGVSYEELVSGTYKGMENPYQKLTDKERAIVQNDLDKMHAYFVSEIARNRRLSENQTKEIATARLFLGEDALGIGLIDVIGGKYEAVALIEKKINETAEMSEYKEKRTFLDSLAEMSSSASFNMGRGMASFFTERKGLQIKI